VLRMKIKPRGRADEFIIILTMIHSGGAAESFPQTQSQSRKLGKWGGRVMAKSLPFAESDALSVNKTTILRTPLEIPTLLSSSVQAADRI